MSAKALGAVLLALFTVPAWLLAAEVGQPAPGFSLPSIHAIHDAARSGISSNYSSNSSSEASVISLDAYRGKVVYLDFWSAWCIPCRDLLPELAAMRRALPADGFELVSINIDLQAEDGLRLLAGTGLNHPVARDPFRTAADQFGIDRLPAGVLVDGAGTVRGVFQGEPAQDVGMLRQAVEDLMTGGVGSE